MTEKKVALDLETLEHRGQAIRNILRRSSGPSPRTPKNGGSFNDTEVEKIESNRVESAAGESAQFVTDVTAFCSIIDQFYDSEEVLKYFQKALTYLDNTRKNEIPTDGVSSSVPTVKLSFVNIIQNLISLRVEYVHRLTRPLLQKFMYHPRNLNLFNQPVDPLALGIPSYFSKIKEPMDLGTVKSKLNKGHYQSIQSCFRDIELVFKNAIEFNPKDHHVHKMALDLYLELQTEIKAMGEKFEKELEKRRQHSCTLCGGTLCLLCGEKCLKFESPVLLCHNTSCNQRIKRNSVFYVTSCSSMVWCQKCYITLPPVLSDFKSNGYSHVSASEENNSEPLLKKNLLKRKFDEEVAEPWVECDWCGLWFHQICALYNDIQGKDCVNNDNFDKNESQFVCPLCKLENEQIGRFSKSGKQNLRNNISFDDGNLDYHVVMKRFLKRMAKISGEEYRNRYGIPKEKKMKKLKSRSREKPLEQEIIAVESSIAYVETLSEIETNSTSEVQKPEVDKYGEDSISEIASNYSETDLCLLVPAQDGNSGFPCSPSGSFTSAAAVSVESTAGLKRNMSLHRNTRLSRHCIPKPPRARFDETRAASLPRSELGDFLEHLIRELLILNGYQSYADSVVIRMTSNRDCRMEVPNPVVENLSTREGKKVPTSMTYRQKCILMFQEIDGVDVCLFSLYVQEFDNSCPAPNTSTVYISYLDSVDYFRPMDARTLVYQEIILGYLKWAQARGFRQGHIWACPPQRGDNFIFWCHPPHQRTPSRERLNSWYKAILQRCQKLTILSDIGDLRNAYFSHLNVRRKDEHQHREAAKRSFVGSGKAAGRKYNKVRKSGEGELSSKSFDLEPSEIAHSLSTDSMEVSNCNDKSEIVVKVENHDTSEISNNCDINGMNSQIPVCPPVFEGDFWVLEFLRLYRSMRNKSRSSKGDNSSGALDPKTLVLKKCREFLKILMMKPHSAAFLQPVDPVELEIPNYFEVIKNPMDFGTIREQVKSYHYSTMYDVVQDVRLTLSNAMEFNPEGHIVHLSAEVLTREVQRLLLRIVGDLVRNLGTLAPPDQSSFSDTPLMLPDGSVPSVENLVTAENLETWLKHFRLPVKEVELKVEPSGIETKDPMEVTSTSTQVPPLAVSNINNSSMFPFSPMALFSTCSSSSFTFEQSTPGVTSSRSSVGVPSSDTDPLKRKLPESFTADTPKEAVLSATGDIPDSGYCCDGIASFDQSKRRKVEGSGVEPGGFGEETEIPAPGDSEMFEEPKMGKKAINVLMTELNKEVTRLQDDLFVVKFAPLSISPEENSEATEGKYSMSSHNPRKPRGRAATYMKRVSTVSSARSALDPEYLKHCSTADPASSRYRWYRRLKDLNPDTSDPDELRRAPLVDSRHTFLEMCQYRCYQFDSLRRAKHSSLMILYYLQHPESSMCKPRCRSCHSAIHGVRWHCDQCPDFDICGTCNEVGNPHGGSSSDAAGRVGVEGAEAEMGGVEQKDDNTSSDSVSEEQRVELPHPHPLTPFAVTFV